MAQQRTEELGSLQLLTDRAVGDGGAERNHVLLSLPEDLADRLMASEAYASLRDHIEIRRTSGAQAAAILHELEGD